MNKLEKFIYDLVKRNPALKTSIRNLYQNILDVLPSKKFKTSYPLINREGYFFGFHDHTPFSSNEKYLLAQKAPVGFFMPNTNDLLKIGFFSGDKYTEFNECTYTKTS